MVINRDKPIFATGAESYSFLINGVQTDVLDNSFRLLTTSGHIITQDSLDREEKDHYLVCIIRYL